MKQASLLLFLFIVAQSAINAQSLTQTIRGEVIDAESTLPLIGANVVVHGIQPLLGSATDANGKFRIEKVPVGRINLKVTYLGYEDAFVNDILVGSGKEIILQISLTESILSLEEGIVVTATPDKDEALNDMASVSARMFTVEETKRYAASVNDPARMALSFAGVAANGDFSNEIVVRGNSPRGLLWRVEGVEIPNPNHFANEGSSGGGVSILSANMLANSDFFTGAFPAEYGNAVSGVFDINLRNGNNEKREYAVQLGLLGADVALEGPFSENSNASYLVNYRYSTLAIFDLIGLDIIDDAVPKFQDLSFKVKLPTKKAGSFSLWGLGGLSNQTSNQPDYQYDYHSNMGATGLTHTFFLHKKTYATTTVSYAISDLGFKGEQLDNPNLPRLDYEDALKNYSFRVSSLANRKINAKNTVRTGMIFSNLGFDLFAQGEEKGVIEGKINQSGNANMWQGYAQWKHRLSEKWTVNSGLHYTYFGLNRTQAIEPRAGLRWQFLPTQSLSAGYGMHSRIFNMEVYMAEQNIDNQAVQINKNLDLVRSQHYVIGYDNLLSKNLRLKVETYYQSLSKIPIRPDSPTFSSEEARALSGLNSDAGYITDSLVSEGTGRNYGIELTLEKFFSNNYYFLVTTSLFQSKAIARDGVERNTRFNNEYIFNLLGGKEFKVGKNGKNNILAFNFRGIWMGGNKKLNVKLQESLQQREAVYDWENAFEDKVPDYFRLDFRISYRKNKPNYASIISLDIQNTTNRKNFYTQYFDEDDLRIENVEQLGLIPVLNYRIEF